MENDINHTMLYNWFDKCGVISNIRTQLRQNLVQALKYKDINLGQPHPRSAKQYVYDLLIAEYLLTTNFTYSLSVFTSEAPLPVNLNQLLTSNNSTGNGKLQNDYLHHILETLGIDPHDSKGHFILSDYLKKDESLLICILQCLKLSSQQNKCLKSNNQIHQTKKIETKNVHTQSDESYNCERCKNLIQIKRKLMKQKEEFDKELNEKSVKLKNQAQVTEQQLVLLEEKMEQAQNLIHSLNTKKKQFTDEKRKEEENIHQKKLELLHKEEFLTKEINRIEVERNSSRQFEENLQRLQNELTKIKSRLSGDDNKTNYSTKNTQVQTDFESFTVSLNEKELLLKEKQDLSSLVREQQERIKQLTHRAVQLSRQLEEVELTKIKGIQFTKRIPHTSTFVSEGSSTEDILQDAKTRLKRLEEESMQAEKQYHDYIFKSSGTSMMGRS